MNTPTFIKSILTIVLGFTLFSTSASAQVSPIAIEDVKFRDFKVKDYDWIEAEIKLKADTASKYEFEGQRDDKFVDNITLTFSVCYETRNSDAGKFEFYRAKVEIVSLKKGEDRYVYFYLPGIIKERDKLDDEPYAWAIQMEISGKELPNDPRKFKENFSTRFSSTEFFESYFRALDERAERNEGMLLPIYYAPGYVTSNSKDVLKSPNYLRRDPQN